jgi:hypothetical protein
MCVPHFIGCVWSEVHSGGACLVVFDVLAKRLRLRTYSSGRQQWWSSCRHQPLFLQLAPLLQVPQGSQLRNLGLRLLVRCVTSHQPPTTSSNIYSTLWYAGLGPISLRDVMNNEVQLLSDKSFVDSFVTSCDDCDWTARSSMGLREAVHGATARKGDRHRPTQAGVKPANLLVSTSIWLVPFAVTNRYHTVRRCQPKSALCSAGRTTHKHDIYCRPNDAQPHLS